MPFLVTDNCVKCKYTDCVEVCPVDCFYEGENFLAINPDECIDCGVCEPECPANAIVSTNDLPPDQSNYWYQINQQYAMIWPNITQRKSPLEDADHWNGIPDKFDSHFSENSG